MMTSNEIIKIISMSKPKLIRQLVSITNHHDELAWLLTPPGTGNRVTLVSHIDTVHDKYRRTPDVFMDQSRKVLWSPDGLGADDRAGVYAALRIYRELSDDMKPNLLFCDEEESGGGGAKDACEVYETLLEKSLFFVGLDRKGTSDCVFYNDEPREFKTYIESHGYREEYGTFSDTLFLGAWFRICATNLSVGFWNEHTETETLWIDDLLRTITLVKHLIIGATRAQRQWENPRANGTYKYSRFNSANDAFPYWRDDIDPPPMGTYYEDSADSPIPVDRFMDRNSGRDHGAISTKLSRKERRKLRKLKRQQKDPFYVGP